jgi:hypothetical protein
MWFTPYRLPLAKRANGYSGVWQMKALTLEAVLATLNPSPLFEALAFVGEKLANDNGFDRNKTAPPREPAMMSQQPALTADEHNLDNLWDDNARAEFSAAGPLKGFSQDGITMNIPSSLRLGLDAEEVARVYPELVTYGEGGEPDSVAYQLLPVVLFKAMQRQVRENQQRDARIETLQQQIVSQQRQISILQRKMIGSTLSRAAALRSAAGQLENWSR